jgi:hypothetical protein
MLIKLFNWLRSKIWLPADKPATIDQQTKIASQHLSRNMRALHIDEQIDKLRLQLTTDKNNCAILGKALHENGLDGFSRSLSQIGKAYGYDFTSQEFKLHLERKKDARPAAYLVQYCRGGGIH